MINFYHEFLLQFCNFEQLTSTNAAFSLIPKKLGLFEDNAALAYQDPEAKLTFSLDVSQSIGAWEWSCISNSCLLSHQDNIYPSTKQHFWARTLNSYKSLRNKSNIFWMTKKFTFLADHKDCYSPNDIRHLDFILQITNDIRFNKVTDNMTTGYPRERRSKLDRNMLKDIFTS